MRLGLCGSIDDSQAMAAAGFDFMEVSAQAVLRGEEDDATWSRSAPNSNMLALPAEAANLLVPSSHPIVGEQRDLAALRTYMQRVAERAARLGISRLVFGSGGARKAPEGFPPERTMEQLVEFCQFAGDCCAPYDVTLVIEPLNRQECNTINSVADGAELTDLANHPAVRLLVDSYHFAIEGEPMSSLVDAAAKIEHVHVAEPVGRALPGSNGRFPGKDAYDFASFFKPLRAAGYDQRISIECSKTDSVYKEAGHAIEVLRGAWAQAAPTV